MMQSRARIVQKVVCMTSPAGRSSGGRRKPPRLPAAALTCALPRCLQAPPAQKLPALYLLDSVSKTVGEPYKSLFLPLLAEVGGRECIARQLGSRRACQAWKPAFCKR